MPKRRWFVVLLANLLLCAAAPAASPKQVDDAIKKGQEFLFSQQKNGNWEPVQQRDRSLNNYYSHSDFQWGMCTASATYGLLASGVSPQEEHVKKAVEFLRKAEITGIYAIGMRAQCWQFLPQTPENKAAMRRDLTFLLNAAMTGQNNKTLYDVTFPVRNPNLALMEPSSYGMLGVSALADAGLEVPIAFWQMADKTWRYHQNPDGGWSYDGVGHPSASAGSGAGVTALFLIEKHLRRNASTNGNFRDPAREKGLRYIGQLKIDEGMELHWMFLVQRIANASALKRFGGLDWYEAMGNTLIKLQAQDGSWYDIINAQQQPGNHIVGTGYGLAILSYGRAPLVINKLKYYTPEKGNDRAEAPWNQRPRDAANVSEWIGKQRERLSNWQIVDVSAPVSELLEAPIVYISGSKAFEMSEGDINNLRDYLQAGGLIVGNSDGVSKDFDTSFLKLGQKLLPTYEFRALPADHVILKKEQYPLDAKALKIRSLSNGVREMMILLQDDYGKSWQRNDVNAKKPDFPFMANVFGYVTDKSAVRYKGDTFVVNANANAPVNKKITLARVVYNGNWDPEPGGWKRLANILRNTQKTELTVKLVKPADLSAKDFPFAHLTAANQFQLSEADRAGIKKYLNDGGTLLIDAAGGNEGAAGAITGELQLITGSTGEPLSNSDDVFKKPVDLSRIGLRGNAASAAEAPRLRVIKINNRNAVYFSAIDFSAALVGQPVAGVNGYSPETAAGLVTNLLMRP